jgi:ActR/RegA family two-component response regulator/predicted Ser/Thr protein kinase
MAERITIASADASFATWLGQRVGTLRPYSSVQTLHPDDLMRSLRAEAEPVDAAVLLLHTSFAAPESLGVDCLRRLVSVDDQRVVVAIAEDGNELAAVDALRSGAADYLPKDHLDGPRLDAVLRQASNLAERRAAAMRRHGGRAVVNKAGWRADLIPQYDVLRVLGESDHSMVYLASAPDMDLNVALKVSREDGGDDSRTREWLAREYQAIAAITHPGVVDIYDYGVHGGLEYLAMEYFPRGDLARRLREPCSVAAGLAYVRRIAVALQAVHEAGLVHRDLKPQNVMLRDDDEIVLIDFGLAKNLHNGHGSTRTQGLRGSPYFMSPEHAQGLPVDRRSDLYALGVILYEVLAGRKPFYGASAMEILHKHVSELPPPLPEAVTGFQPIIDRLLAKSPNDRYDHAEEVAAIL